MYKLVPIVYPNGFVRPESVKEGTPTHVQVDGLDMVNELMSDWRNSEVSKGTWDFRAKVLKTAVQAIGSIHPCIMAQINAPTVKRDQLLFLIDTFMFVLKGSRGLSMGSWPALLAPTEGLADGVSASNENLTLARRELKELLDTAIQELGSVEEILSLWVSRDNGLEDLVLSLGLLYGKSINAV